MIFGGSGKIKDVGFSELADILNADFEAKMRGFAERCRQASSRIDRSRKMFIDACASFEKSEVKPDIDREYYYSKVDPSLIESQKINYLKALRGIVGSTDLPSAPTTYENNVNILGMAKEQRERILRTNNTFRGVFMAYAKHLDGFKEASLELDKAISKLDYELEREKDSYEEYKRTIDSVFRLSDLKRLLDDARTEETQIDRHEHDRSIEITVKKEVGRIGAELSAISKSIEKSSGSISTLFLPLERPARKYDHITGKKSRLGDAIENPIDVIADADTYRQLREDLLSLADAVRKGEIELKNKEDIFGDIARICDASIVEEALEIKRMKKDREQMERQFIGAETELDRETAKSLENAAEMERKSGLQQEIRNVSDEISTIKSVIESAYWKSYKRKIRILLDN